MSYGIHICLYPRSPDFFAGQNFLEIAKSLDRSNYAESLWGDFRILDRSRKKYLYEADECLSLETLNSTLLNNRALDKSSSNSLECSAFTWLEQWQLTEETKLKKKQKAALNVTTWDKKHPRGYAYLYDGFAELYISPGSYYITQTDDKDLSPESTYKDHNECVEKNLNVLRELLRSIIAILDPLSLKIFTSAGPFLPFNSHATYFANTNSFIRDLHMIKDFWVGNFAPYYHEPPRPLKDSDPIRQKFDFNEQRTDEQRIELWETYTDCLRMLDYVTPEVVNLALDVEQSVEEGGLDIQRTENGGTLVFGSKDFFNSFVSDVYLDALEIAYHQQA
ncbi:hypothetical protein [Gimesia fumaroli]|uniref:Uncharacterized protein n=1 Tax=Gimesia fumaroli TaxID=2527976 RepID=A0A518I576_9PLAN|nr:hypothetical protein [Gimesia fumaroli]QDV48205.1 hypothetical protein Enr17x_02160 [Gimesia fumaroli]